MFQGLLRTRAQTAAAGGGTITTGPDDVTPGLRQAAARVAAGHGLEVFDLQFRREAIGWVLRVILDRVPGEPGAAESAVSIDDCRRVSEDLGVLLDVEDDLVGGPDRAYTLEVSSPGLDRPLRHEADFVRFAGRLAKIVTHEPLDGQAHFRGRLAGVERGVVLLAEGRRTHRVPLAAIRRARLEVEF